MSFFYTEEHLYIKMQNDEHINLLGISEYAQDVLGEIVFVSMVEPNTILKKNERFATLESSKVATDIYAPIDCKIVTVNNDLLNNPSLINSSPFDDGWLYLIEIADTSDLQNFMDENSYKEYCKSL